MAVPVRSGKRLVGGINLIFPKAAVSREEVQKRYLPRLRQLALRMGRDMGPWLE